MSDKSIVRGGNLVGDGCSVFEHSALDQSLFYPSDMSALPTSTPNPANLRRKSRRSWFETTPKGFKFEIAVEKPAVKAPVRKSDTVEVLTLTHFSGAPRLGFGTLKVGHEKTCTLLLRNPHDYQQSVKVEKFPEKKHFSISCKEFIVGPEESYPLDITWSPKEAGGCREMVMMQVDGAYRVQAYVFGTVTAPPPQKKKAVSLSSKSLLI
jgi:abnormal spindle-like microcephaly-associated protein